MGPEILLRLLAGKADLAYRAIVVAERSVLAACAEGLGTPLPDFLVAESGADELRTAIRSAALVLVDPVGSDRRPRPGSPGPEDALGAIAALDLGIDLMAGGLGDALVTCPLTKSSIAAHARPGFVGHTDYLARAAGLERYGRDYLMTFLAGDLKVALLTTHLPLREALDRIEPGAIADALACLHRHAPGRIAVAGLNPHAGEGGLLGSEDDTIVRPAVQAARAAGIDVAGPFSADSLFARARGGEFDWVLALYHDQGLIAVKTVAFGHATNWTLGLPWLRTSVDHGTAYDIAGRGRADAAPLAHVVATTLDLIAARK